MNIGDKRHFLTLLEVVGIAPDNRNRLGKFRCDCGTEKVIRIAHVTRGTTTACGCRIIKLANGESGMHLILGQYRRNAKVKGREFTLTEDQFRFLTSQPCFYCGCEPHQRSHTQSKKGRRCNGVYVYNGLDRIDNDKGYVPENVVPCCRFCNFGKQEMSAAEYIQSCKRISERWQN